MKRAVAIIIVLLLTICPAFSQKKELYRVRTVVIDPGHGGAKPGAQGKQSQEKTITLNVAKKVGKLISDNYPDVKVIFTRTTDVDISLAERAEIANSNHADLFISIHANSHPTAAPTGVETFVMGLSESKANLEVAKKENADILLEKDYKNNSAYGGFDPNAPETYVMLTMFQNAYIDKSLNLAQAIQNQYKQNLRTINRGVKQAELYVLYKTAMPSVLTEVGFISNPTEEEFMLSEEGSAKIAISIFNAFMTYKSTEEGSARLSSPKYDIAGYQSAEAKPTVPKPQPEAVAEAKEEPKEEAPAVQTVPAPPAPSPAPPQQHDIDTIPASSPAPQEIKPVVTPAEKPLPKVDLPPVQQKAETPTAPSKTTPEPAPATQHKPAPKAETKPVAAAVVTYRVQFCTSNRQMKAGDPDLQGIRDFHIAQQGKYFMYTAGDYKTLAEARTRCEKIKSSTRFNDAFVIAIYKGERISLERAAQIQKQKK